MTVGNEKLESATILISALASACGTKSGHPPAMLIAARIKNRVDYAGRSDDKQRLGNYLQSA